MSRFVLRVGVSLICLIVGMIPVAFAASSELPACAADFSGKAVLHGAVLDAMIAQAEPSGSRPDREMAMLFIVVKHYLSQGEQLLVVSRQQSAQPPVLLQGDCLPAPAESAARGPLQALTEAQTQQLVVYYDLVDSSSVQATEKVETMASVPAVSTDSQAQVGSFSIDVYEVTNAQYRAFIDADGYANSGYWTEPGWTWLQTAKRQQPSYWENDQLNLANQPVVGVTWYEAAAFCHWSGKELPTEAQWDRTCRGDDGRKYPWGDTPRMADEKMMSSDEISTAAVGSAPHTQSPYGVHDLAGSALEWTATAHEGGGYVLRGGSGPSVSTHVGCEVSHQLLPTMAANFIGFRCQSAAAAQ